MINGEYQKTEVHNLGRFISVMKYRPLQWRTTHPYILVDRYCSAQISPYSRPIVSLLKQFFEDIYSLCKWGQCLANLSFMGFNE